MGYYYQSAWITPKDLANGELEIYNENFFKTLDDLELVWTIRKHSGTINISGIAPQQRKVITDAELKATIARVLEHHPDAESFVNFEFRSREAQPLIDKGQVLARQQFSLKDYQFPTLDAASANASLKVEETVSYVRFEAAGTALTIGKQSGWIDYLDVNGTPMLVDNP